MPPQLQWCFIVASKTCYSGWWLLSLRIGPICASWSVDTWTSSIIGDCNETQDFYFKLNDLDWSDWSKQSTGTGLLPSNYMGADLVGSNLVCCLATTILLDILHSVRTWAWRATIFRELERLWRLVVMPSLSKICNNAQHLVLLFVRKMWFNDYLW